MYATKYIPVTISHSKYHIKQIKILGIMYKNNHIYKNTLSYLLIYDIWIIANYNRILFV